MPLNRREVLAACCGGLFATGLGPFRGFASAQADPLPPKRYVDVHRHVLPPEFGGNPEEDLDKTLAWMDRYGVMQAVVLGAYNIGPGAAASVGQAKDALRDFSNHGDVLFPFCSIAAETSVGQSELIAILAQLKAIGIRGLGEFKMRGMRMDDPWCMAVFAACAEVGLPVLFHTDESHCIDDPGLPGLERVLQSHADLTLIAHGPGWWASISGDVETREELGMRPTTRVVAGGAIQRLLDAYPNLNADLSASSGLNAIRRDPDHGLEFLTEYQDRLLFGTDTAPEPSPDAMPAQLPEVVRQGLFDNWGHFDYYPSLELPAEVARKIYEDNARRILGLPEPRNAGGRLSA